MLWPLLQVVCAAGRKMALVGNSSVLSHVCRTFVICVYVMWWIQTMPVCRFSSSVQCSASLLLLMCADLTIHSNPGLGRRRIQPGWRWRVRNVWHIHYQPCICCLFLSPVCSAISNLIVGCFVISIQVLQHTQGLPSCIIYYSACYCMHHKWLAGDLLHTTLINWHIGLLLVISCNKNWSAFVTCPLYYTVRSICVVVKTAFLLRVA